MNTRFLALATAILILFCSMEKHNILLDHTIFVAVNGDDNGLGTVGAPLKSLNEAINRANQLSSAGNIAIHIYLRQGIYEVANNIRIQHHDYALTISNYKNEDVVLSGGKAVNHSRIRKVEDVEILNRLPNASIDHIYFFNLDEMGIAGSTAQTRNGFDAVKSPSPMELFVNGEPQTVARWPNDGMLTIDTVYQYENKAKSQQAIFRYSGADRQWKQQEDIWVAGYFSVGWAYDNIPVEFSSDGRSNIVKAIGFTSYGIFSKKDEPTYVTKAAKNIRGFYFYNTLEELDEPGEWYLDNTTNNVYFWPAEILEESEIDFSVNDSRFLISLIGVENLIIKGLRFNAVRGSALQINTSKNVQVVDCIFENIGLSGIEITASEDVITSNSSFRNIGAMGVFVTGGNRKNLAPGNNRIVNCEFDNFSRRYKNYTPAIFLNGVGHTIENCLIQNSTGQGIIFSGNDHIITNNHLKNLCKEFQDIGAIYTGRDASATGTVIKGNFFEDIGIDNDEQVAAVYFDDGSGGFQVLNNVFYRSGSRFGAVHINGGGSSVFENNAFIDCDLAFSNSLWSDQQWINTFEKDQTNKNKLFRDVDIRSELYQVRYPWLAGIIDPNNLQRYQNIVSNSLVYGTKKLTSNNVLETEGLKITGIANKKGKPNIGNNYTRINSLIPRSIKRKKNWQAIDFNNFGTKR